MSIPIIGTCALKALGWRRQEKQQGDDEGRREELAHTEQRILVRRRHNLELLRLGVIPEPSPPAALNAGGGRIHLLLEPDWQAGVQDAREEDFTDLHR